MVALILFVAALALFLADGFGISIRQVPFGLTPLGLACVTGALLAQMLLL